jgi:hypothetical protein
MKEAQAEIGNAWALYFYSSLAPVRQSKRPAYGQSTGYIQNAKASKECLFIILRPAGRGVVSRRFVLTAFTPVSVGGQ